MGVRFCVASLLCCLHVRRIHRSLLVPVLYYQLLFECHFVPHHSMVSMTSRRMVNHEASTLPPSMTACRPAWEIWERPSTPSASKSHAIELHVRSPSARAHYLYLRDVLIRFDMQESRRAAASKEPKSN